MSEADKEAGFDDAADRRDTPFEVGGIVDDAESAVQDVVPVIRNESPVVLNTESGAAPEGFDLQPHELPAEGRYFHGQRESAEAILEFRFVGYDDFAAAGGGHKFLAQQRASSALDQIKGGIDLVGAVDGQVDPGGQGEIRKRDSLAFRLNPGLFRRGYTVNPKALPNPLAQSSNSKMRRGSGPQTNDHPVVREVGGPFACKLFRVGSHDITGSSK